MQQKVTYADGSKYEGMTVQSLSGVLIPHGKGVMTETGGTKYEGNFKDGERDGNGMLKYANGDVYNGEFKDGRMHGQGVVQYANGDSYTGQLQGGKPHGKGVMTETGGTKYEGNFKDGIIHGTGVMKYANGRKYNGEFNDGRIFVDVKQKNPSTKKTVLFQSSQLKKAEDKQWGHGRFIDQNHLITRYNGIENANEVIAKLNNLAEVNEGASTKFKVVFDQHGGEQGWNDIKVDTESAEQMLKMLYSKGYRDITVSDLSCHGGTASHFKEISQAFVNTNPDINVTIRASVEGRTVIPCDSNNGTKFRTIGKDGEVLKREKTVYKSNLTQIVGGNTNEESKESSLLHKNTTMKNASITKSLNNRQ